MMDAAGPNLPAANGLPTVPIAALALLTALLFAAPLAIAATVVLLPLAAFSAAASLVGVATLLAEQAPVGAATTMALNGALFNLGAAGGGAIGGGLLAAGGYGALGLGLPLFALAASLLVGRRAGAANAPALGRPSLVNVPRRG